MIRSIYDGVQRPLNDSTPNGDFIVRGAESPALSRETQWTFERREDRDKVASGDLLGTVQESKLSSTRSWSPPTWEGKITRIGPVTGNVDTRVAGSRPPTAPLT